MGTSSARKPRKHKSITDSAENFSESLHNRNFDKTAKIVVSTALSVLGKKGLIGALDNANSLIKRIKRRRGL